MSKTVSHDFLERIQRDLTRNFKECMERKSIGSEDIVYWFVKLRQFTEFLDLNPNPYSHVNLYGNWILHTKLDKAKSTSLVKSLSKIAGDYLSQTNKIKNHSDRISETISIAILRKEILDLLAILKCSKTLFDTEFFWNKIVSTLMLEIVNKDFLIADDIEIEKLLEKTPFAAKQFRLMSFGPNTDIRWLLLPHEKSKFGKPLTGKLYITEGPDSFEERSDLYEDI
ncbi:hypothetical protein DOM22_10980 [Bdellovibrio sp. ZAP7]|uniref:hypothetical protein n=1 Tax=Bdellovibrio sp. ZAP7 TaxID=2231053 RepID=UPI00115736EB|nr:hypothetical protein [Bdellovibrio sp. ZAP7]QDK45635.1 hypothetical protein DOM22_10980 [Bdellovibrio sp. ZAP7]